MINGQYKLYDQSTGEFKCKNYYDKIFVDRNRTFTVIKNNKYGILNHEGNLIVNCEYDLARGFDENGLALVQVDKRAGFINMENQFVIPLIFDQASEFKEGLSSVNIGGKVRFIDVFGNFNSEKIYEQTSSFFNGRCAVKINGKWGLIDGDENILIPPEYDSIIEENEICRVDQNGKFFLIDLTNNVISDFYDFIDYCSEGIYQVRQKSLWGHIRESGEVLIPLAYEGCTDFQGDFAGACLNGKWFFIDRYNSRIIHSEKYGFSELRNVIEDGIAVAAKDSGWGIIDLRQDRLVTDFIYEDSWGIKGGLCSFLKNSKWGYVDNFGVERIEFRYSDAGSFEDGNALVKKELFKNESMEICFYIDEWGFEYRES